MYVSNSDTKIMLLLYSFSSRVEGCYCYNECIWGHVAMCSSCTEAVSEWMPPVHGSRSRLPHSKGKHTGIECSQQKRKRKKSWCISSTTGLVSVHPCKVWAWWTVLTRPAKANIINTGVTGKLRGERQVSPPSPLLSSSWARVCCNRWNHKSSQITRTGD